ncbi:hypothetical protein GCM10019016_099240 [Streptomyces prasinosporus]|uniref:HTH cro/C1-type domain-containing protein n=1 Tax=Streptomyces prasinosporus TaxID=68256 RepID=A0ABP6U6M7_9ACTN
MPRWRPLPESLDLPVRRLVVQMRQAKDHSGLSLTALANRTGYSRSSWERCLNGRALPPLWAVEALANACGGDRTTLTALWEVAASADAADTAGAARSHGAAKGPAAAPPDEAADEPVPGPAGISLPARGSAGAPVPADAYGRGPDVRPEAALPDGRAASGRTVRRGATVVVPAAAAVALLVTAGVLAVARPWESSARPGGTVERSAVPVSTYSPRTFPCYFTVREGLLYAGHSTTLTDPYAIGTTVEAVAEVQCLVRKHGFDPQGIDASFGPNTRAAVQRFQRSRGLEDDGVVGPDTWRELRRPGD